jgi:hypothetical protein
MLPFTVVDIKCRESKDESRGKTTRWRIQVQPDMLYEIMELI